jgi:hypothetical protein
MVSNIEPPLPSPRQTSWELVRDVILFHPLPQLQSDTTDFIHGTLARLWFEMEVVAKEVEAGFYPQEGFTEMNKNGNMENRIGVEMMELDSIVEEKAMKEIRCRKGQSVLNKILKKNNLLSPFIWSLVTSGRVPLDYLLGLHEAFIYHCLRISFEQLTCSPPVSSSIGGLGVFPFRLGGTFLAHHS